MGRVPMTKLAIRIIEDAAGFKSPLAGHYVRGMDPDKYNGRGHIMTTTDPDKALLFDDAMAAHDFYSMRSKAHPWRDDGKPNRPLTAFTVSIGPIESLKRIEL